MIDLPLALATATDAALAAGELLRDELHRPGGPRGWGDHAPVDGEAETLIRARLEARLPDIVFQGEETAPAASDAALLWTVDPNDGTRSFLRGARGSAVSIALLRDRRPVLGVVYAPCAPDDRGDLITWCEGQPLRRNHVPAERAPLPRRLEPGHVVIVSQGADANAVANAACVAPARFRSLPSIAYRLALVAAGEGDAAVSLNGPTGWDVAAGHALLRAVGGELLDERGEPFRYTGRSSHVFGGSEEVARALAAAPWRRVFQPAARSELEERYPLTRPEPRKHVRDPRLLARAQGCLLGQLAGDALGSLVEFRSPDEIARRYPAGMRELEDGGTWNTIAGQPTDDSEMALVLARSILQHGRYDPQQAFAAYRHWIESGPFDSGATTRNGLQGRPDAGSEANGALMRVSPLAVHAFDSADAARLAREDAALTHPAPVCQDASAAFTVAIGHALRGGDAAGAYEAAVAWARAGAAPSVLAALEAARSGPPGEFTRSQGWVLIALQNAFHQLLSAESLAAGVIDTVHRGGDTDTNAAIAGALLGAVHGRDAVPLSWRRAILTCRPLPHTPRPRPMTFWPVDALEVAERLVCR